MSKVGAFQEARTESANASETSVSGVTDRLSAYEGGREAIIPLKSYYLPMAITYEFWVANLIQGAKDVADEETQNRRWIAPDAYAWERPAELLSVLLDDMQLELFIEEHGARLSKEQLCTVKEFAQVLLDFDCGPDGWRDPNDVLRDPRWEGVRIKARAFVSAYEAKLNSDRVFWPGQNCGYFRRKEFL